MRNAAERARVFTDLAEARRFVDACRPTRVVLANGCFDPLHVGHVRYLEDARRHGDFLVVALNSDESTTRLKGPGRPILAEGDRAAILSSLRAVEAVIVFADDTVAAVLEALRPHVHAKGTDYTVETVPERDVSQRLGIETVIAGDVKSHASREIVSRIRNRPGGGSG